MKVLLLSLVLLSGCSLFESQLVGELEGERTEISDDLERGEDILRSAREAEIRTLEEARRKEEEARQASEELRTLEVKYSEMQVESARLRAQLEQERRANTSPEAMENLETRLQIADESRMRLASDLSKTRGETDRAVEESRDAQDAAKSAKDEVARAAELIATLRTEVKSLSKQIDARKRLDYARAQSGGLKTLEGLGDAFSGSIPGGGTAWTILAGLLGVLGVRKYLAKREEKAEERAKDLGVA